MSYINDLAITKLANQYRNQDLPSWKLAEIIRRLAKEQTVAKRLTLIEVLLFNVTNTQKESVN